MYGISGGDWRYFWPETVRQFAHLPIAWDPFINNGLGQSDLQIIWLTSFLNLTSSASFLGLSWNEITILFWILPALCIGFFSAFFLYKTFFQRTFFAFLAGCLYLINTFFLMVFNGGQLGFALGYAWVPLTILLFIQLINAQSENKTHWLLLKCSLLAGLVFAIQVMFDLRIAYIALLAIGIYTVVVLYRLSKQYLHKILSFLFYTFIVPLGVTGMLHAFWLLPVLLGAANSVEQLGQGYTSNAAVTFFSFAKLENSLSLLHPNYPENIFGKVYFMKAGFLLLPILAFASLLFIQRVKNTTILLFFVFLSLVGAFLAKGVNEPFGQIYLWLFNHMPGFILFRDPVKFYLLVAVSYSILIPFTLQQLDETIKKVSVKKSLKIFLLIGIIFSFFLLAKPLVTSQSRGIMTSFIIPQEYRELKNYLQDDPTPFFRTFWIPQVQRYAFMSNEHPAVHQESLFKRSTLADTLKIFKKNDTQTILQDSSIKYVIVPYDSRGEFFVKDRNYSELEYKKIVQGLEKTPWLKEKKRFGKMIVFEVNRPKDHVWSTNPTTKVAYHRITATAYSVTVANARKGDRIVFAESYDQHWISENGIKNEKYANRFNSFVLPKNGAESFIIAYETQNWVLLGTKISLLTLVGIVLVLLLKRKTKKKII